MFIDGGKYSQWLPEIPKGQFTFAQELSIRCLVFLAFAIATYLAFDSQTIAGLFGGMFFGIGTIGILKETIEDFMSGRFRSL